MNDKDYQFVFESMKKLLQCLPDTSRPLLLAEIQDLHLKEMQMVDVASVHKMQKETEYLRAHVAYLSASGQAKKFSLRLRADHPLKVFPNISSAASFLCKVCVVDGPVAVGMHVGGAAVDAGTHLMRATDALDGYISKISIIDEAGAVDSSGAPDVHTSALTGQIAFVEVVVLKMHSFSFPGLEREAQKQAALIATLHTMIQSDGCDAAFKKIAGEVIGKFKNNQLLSDPQKLFWDEFSRNPEDAKKLLSPLSASTATGAAAKSFGMLPLPSAAAAIPRSPASAHDSAHSSDESRCSLSSSPTVLSPVTTPTSAARSLPQLLELLGLRERPVSEQKAWVESEQAKLQAAGLTKDERKVLREWVLEPSQSVDDMLRVLEGHKNFLGVSDSAMSHQARHKLLKKREGELVAIFPLKGDRELLLRELAKLCKPSPAVSESSVAVPSPSPAAAAAAPAPAPASAPPSTAVAAPDASTVRDSQALAAAPPAAAPDDDDAAHIARLVELLARAEVVPAARRHDLAKKLLEQGVCSERAIWRSLSASPPDFDLINDIGMTAPQKRCLDSYLKDLKL